MALYPRDDGTAINLSSDNALPELVDERKRITTAMSDLGERA